MNLIANVVSPFSLNDLAEFIKVADAGLMKETEEGDYDGLVECMGHLLAVKERQATTDEMFEPLKLTIELLRQNGQELPEEVHQQLQVRGCKIILIRMMLRNTHNFIIIHVTHFGQMYYDIAFMIFIIQVANCKILGPNKSVFICECMSLLLKS